MSEAVALHFHCILLSVLSNDICKNKFYDSKFPVLPLPTGYILWFWVHMPPLSHDIYFGSLTNFFLLKYFCWFSSASSLIMSSFSCCFYHREWVLWLLQFIGQHGFETWAPYIRCYLLVVARNLYRWSHSIEEFRFICTTTLFSGSKNMKWHYYKKKILEGYKHH